MKPFSNDTWTGEEKIVLGIDCGTTMSAVAYSYLYPGGPKNFQRVYEWPGQEALKGESKIPTIVWYDEDGKARAFGAEARTPKYEDQAEDEQWHLAEYFKLHLHPSTMRSSQQIVIEPLPAGVTLQQVYADFFGYLFKHTQTFFEDHEIGGPEIWANLRDKIEIVIAHPNGWGPQEQGFLRQAAIQAGMVTAPGLAHHQILFVSEAEASVHFVMLHADLEARLKVGTDFIVCDAGGSTVDTTLYTVTKEPPLLELKEKRASACVQAGAIFVDQTAKAHFAKVFSAANLNADVTKEYIDQALKSFELEAKKSFKGTEDESIVKVGGSRLTEKTLGIRRGNMTLEGTQTEKFFSPWVDQIINSVRTQMDGHAVKYLLVVGGFGDSPYLRRRLKQEAATRGVEVTLANDSASKAVADGAVMWAAKQTVVARATRFSFGIPVAVCFDPTNPKHRGRAVQKNISGDRVHGVWSEIVGKDHVLGTDEEKTCSYRRAFGSPNPSLANFDATVYAYTGPGETPYFMFDPSGKLAEGFMEVCTVQADLSTMRNQLRKWLSENGTYWAVAFDVAITFGATELKSSLVWEDQNKQRRGAATLIPSKFV